MAEDPIRQFADFSKAFDELQEARKAVEKYGTARLANPPPSGRAKGIHGDTQIR